MERVQDKAAWPTLPDVKVETMTVEALKASIVHHLHYHIAKDRYTATARDCYYALAYAVRDMLIQRWITTQRKYYNVDAKRVYYISMEFLMGRTLENSLVNLEVYDTCRQALTELGLSFQQMVDMEWDAALGNGGLGRLAACFLDSMATVGLASHGYGLRYDYGIFYQHIKDGYQVESPDSWLRYGNPWEISRPEYLYPVQFGGRVVQYVDERKHLKSNWIDTEDVMAMAYDSPIPGYKTDTVNTLRLWSAQSSRGFELDYFQHGDYIKSLEDKISSENITRVLYPADDNQHGKELRLKQEYFLVSATLQDIMRRFKKTGHAFEKFPEKVALQLNDTHPSLAVPELMRILVDKEGLSWDNAWRITVNSCAYTNHTILPEALEVWPVELLERLLPRHLQIIYEINKRWLTEISKRFPGEPDRLRKLSLVNEEGGKSIRMAYLSIVGSHYVNGVSALHSNLIKATLFKDFYEILPLRFTNKTNGVTPRRWLKQINKGLSTLITEAVGEGWTKDLSKIKTLETFATDASFQKRWQEVKEENKLHLIDFVSKECGVLLHANSIFDVQVKRIHEYKRQLLNILHVISLYNDIKDNPEADFVPRSMIFAGKAAPSYHTAKMIIKLINSVGDVVNNDPVVRDRLKVAFIPNYRVSAAELIFPASNVSEQISTAGTEASGTGNMKFTLNGALTIGTLDGANVEICEEVGEENIFIFGHKTPEIAELKANGYNPWDYYNNQPVLKRVIDDINKGYFSPEQPDLFHGLTHSILDGGDAYCVCADFSMYRDCQKELGKAYLNQADWTRQSIVNVACAGKFSSDRTILEYAEEIWDSPCY